MYGAPRPYGGGNRRAGRRYPVGGMGGGHYGGRSPSPNYSDYDTDPAVYESSSDEPDESSPYGFPNDPRGGYGGGYGSRVRHRPGGPRDANGRRIRTLVNHRGETIYYVLDRVTGRRHLPTVANDAGPSYGRASSVGSAGSGGYGGGYDSRGGSPGPMGGRRGGYGGMAPGMGGPGGPYGEQGGMAPGMGGRVPGGYGGMAPGGRRRGGGRQGRPGAGLYGERGPEDDPHYGEGAGARYGAASPPRRRREGGGRREREHYDGGGVFPDSGDESW